MKTTVDSAKARASSRRTNTSSGPCPIFSSTSFSSGRLPFAPIPNRFTPQTPTYSRLRLLFGVFLTPFALEVVFPSDALEEGYFLRFPRSFVTFMGRNERMRAFEEAIKAFLCEVRLAKREVKAEELVAILETTRRERVAVKAERKAHDAILEAVLAWKSRRDEARRRTGKK
ncbi:hypothetical protein JCM8547_009247 [Rhodosporidiobolus lusitaniae]